MILLIVSIVLGLACAGYTIYQVIQLTKEKMIGGEEYHFNREISVKLLIFIAIQGVFTICSSYGLVLYKDWNIKLGEHFLLIFGSYLFGSGFLAGLTAFLIRYYHIQISENIRKTMKYIMLLGVVAFVLGIYLLSTSVADYLQTPYISGIKFKDGIGFMRSDEEFYDGFKISWYGVVIVTGTVIAYFVADHIIYKKYKSHGQLEVFAVVVFLFGIIGARLWYCLGLGLPGDRNYYFEHPIEILYIWQGGLGIQGGIIAGLITATVYILVFRKNLNYRYVLDVAAPCVLIAQACGRWGNFFNREVFGFAVSSDVMKIFPKIVTNNMFINGEYRLPLFFIEFCSNLAGFFVIRYAVGRGLKKWISLGDMAGCYFIWYGATRLILEKLRDSEFEYDTSWVLGIIMLGFGVLFILFNHLYDLYRKKKGLEPHTLETI